VDRVPVVVLVVVAACGFSSGNGDDQPAFDAAMTDDGPPPPIDGPPDFTCPASYNVVAGTSRYRIVASMTTWYQAEAACEVDLQHLVIFDDETEFAAVAASPFFSPGDEYWLGLVQDSTATLPDEKWRRITGGMALITWQPGEPDDYNGEEDGSQQVATHEGATLSIGDSPVDATPRPSYICECDGLRRDPGVLDPPLP
jgi:hypothetical protein